jgi:hypothetical protein
MSSLYSASNWTPDTFSNVCQSCQCKFTMFFRRHHCRACGALICSQCSTFVLQNRTSNSKRAKRVRICEECGDLIQNLDKLYETLDKCIYFKNLDFTSALHALESVDRFFSIVGDSKDYNRLKQLATEVLKRIVIQLNEALSEVISTFCLAGNVRLPPSDFVGQLISQCARVYSLMTQRKWLCVELDFSQEPFQLFDEVMKALTEELACDQEETQAVAYSSSSEDRSILSNKRVSQVLGLESESEEENMRNSCVTLSYSPTGSVHLVSKNLL